jgi:hypothetical protein
MLYAESNFFGVSWSAFLESITCDALSWFPRAGIADLLQVF